jgi:hypothetical protein
MSCSSDAESSRGPPKLTWLELAKLLLICEVKVMEDNAEAMPSPRQRLWFYQLHMPKLT